MSRPADPITRRRGRYLLPISPATRAKLEAYCALYRLPDPDAVAERILAESLADLQHEDLLAPAPAPSPAPAPGGGS